MLGYGASLFCFIPRLFGSRVWINMDGVEWRRSKWSWLAKAWLRASEAFAMWTPNRIIADAAAIKTELCARHPHLPPCAVIPYGAPVVTDAQPRLLDEWNLDASGYCLVVCRLEPENHVFEILEGYLASASRLPLVVVGNYTTDTPYVRHLLALSDDRIRLIGTIYDASKLQALRLFARLYFHGHSAGGTNPSLLEAMGCGNAVIAHDNPFNREVAADAALYFSSSGDIPALLEKVASDSTRRAAMQDAARRIVTERYTWESVTEAYLSLLSSDRSRVP
jgi:glycosyltransferase involved in cell wall biosynthesis